MKNLIVLVLMFLFFTCQVPTQKVEKEILTKENATNISTTTEVIFPVPAGKTQITKNFNFGTSLFAEPTVIQATADFLVGKTYHENAYEHDGKIHELDVSYLTGGGRGYFVLDIRVIATGANPGNLDLHIRAAGENTTWTIINVNTVGTYRIEGILSGITGKFEFYANNTAPLDWTPDAEIGFEHILGNVDFQIVKIWMGTGTTL